MKKAIAGVLAAASVGMTAYLVVPIGGERTMSDFISQYEGLNNNTTSTSKKGFKEVFDEFITGDFNNDAEDGDNANGSGYASIPTDNNVDSWIAFTNASTMSDVRKGIVLEGLDCIKRGVIYHQMRGPGNPPSYCRPGVDCDGQTAGVPFDYATQGDYKAETPLYLDCSFFVKHCYFVGGGLKMASTTTYDMVGDADFFTIPQDQLIPGDIGIHPGHVKLFLGNDPNGVPVWAELSCHKEDSIILIKQPPGDYVFRRLKSLANDTTYELPKAGAGSSNTTSQCSPSDFKVNDAELFVIVEGTGGSNCTVNVYEKTSTSWNKKFSTNGILGRSGLSANRSEGDGTTPVGVFKLNSPFGSKDAESGFPSDYFKVDGDDYWSEEKATYNKMIKNSPTPISGEAIGSPAFGDSYNYVLDTGYNPNGVYMKGSALFLHCVGGGATSTAGCIAVPEKDMISIMKLYAAHEGKSYIATGESGKMSNLYGTYGTNNGLSPADGLKQVMQSTQPASVSASTLTNGQEVGLDASWQYANFSKINSGKAKIYKATSNSKGITVAVNAGHGCKGGSGVKTQSHPDGTGKYTGGTNAQGDKESQSISVGMDFADGTSEASVNLKVAIAMRDALLSKGYDVLMIRESDDQQLDNIARTVIANNTASLHVAIHFDSTSTDKGAYYMSVVDVAQYKEMEPVKSHWQEHDKLGEAMLDGLSANGVKIMSGRKSPSDLTQTSYSTIPSVDIELGDKVSDHSDSACTKYGKSLADGVDKYFK